MQFSVQATLQALQIQSYGTAMDGTLINCEILVAYALASALKGRHRHQLLWYAPCEAVTRDSAAAVLITSFISFLSL